MKTKRYQKCRECGKKKEYLKYTQYFDGDWTAKTYACTACGNIRYQVI